MRERETGQPPPEWNTFCSHQTCADSPLTRHFLFTQAHIRGATITTWPGCKRYLQNTTPSPHRIDIHFFFFFFYGCEKQNCGLSSLHVSLFGLLATCCFISCAFVTSNFWCVCRSNATIRREAFRKIALLLLQLSAYPLFLVDGGNGSIGGFVTLDFHKTFEDISLPYCFLILLFASNKDQSSFFFPRVDCVPQRLFIAVLRNQMPNGCFLTYNFL